MLLRPYVLCAVALRWLLDVRWCWVRADQAWGNLALSLNTTVDQLLQNPSAMRTTLQVGCKTCINWQAFPKGLEDFEYPPHLLASVHGIAEPTCINLMQCHYPITS